MEEEKIAPPQNIVDSIQKELADLEAAHSKSIEAMSAYKGKKLFKIRAEADEFLKTPEAKKENMILWVVRKGGKNPCFMVNTPERIKLEKKSHKAMSKMKPWQKNISIMMGVTGMIAAVGIHFMSSACRKKFLELKLKYVQGLHHGATAAGASSMPSEKIISILKELSYTSYRRAEIETTRETGVSIWLFGVRRRAGIRQDLYLFDVRVTIYLKNGNRDKVRHCQFDVFSPSSKYQFSWPKRVTRSKRIKFPWKTGCLGRPSLMLNRLKRSIEHHPKPNEGVRSLYALTRMPNLHKVIPEVEQFLARLHPQLFSREDYMDWTSRRIKRTLDEATRMKRTLAIPEEKPLAIGVDMTSRIMDSLIGSLEKWHRHEKQIKGS